MYSTLCTTLYWSTIIVDNYHKRHNNLPFFLSNSVHCNSTLNRRFSSILLFVAFVDLHFVCHILFVVFCSLRYSSPCSSRAIRPATWTMLNVNSVSIVRIELTELLSRNFGDRTVSSRTSRSSNHENHEKSFQLNAIWQKVFALKKCDRKFLSERNFLIKLWSNASSKKTVRLPQTLRVRLTLCIFENLQILNLSFKILKSRRDQAQCFQWFLLIQRTTETVAPLSLLCKAPLAYSLTPLNYKLY